MKLRFDLHIHSKYSHDSRMSPKRIIREAKKKGLDGIAITDHEEFMGAIETEKISKEFIVIKGEEIKTDLGDIIGLFLTNIVKPGDSNVVIREIKRQGGVVVIPHPLMYHILNDDLMNKIDALEVFNSRVGTSANDMAKKLALKKKKIGLAGSDAHTFFEIGQGVTVIDTKSKSLKDIKEAILMNKIEIVGKRPILLKRILIKFLKYLRENVS